MRFIGCKNLLLEDIAKIIEENGASKGSEVFCDLFAGTGVVGHYFKNRYRIIANDLLYFSFVICKALIGINQKPDFSKLLKFLKTDDLFSYLENSPLTEEYCDKNFVAQNYSPNISGRKYFTPDNAFRIDFIRQNIETFRQEKLVDENEYFYLLASLIEGIPFVSNITGTYGAYLKDWDKRSFKKILMQDLCIIDNKKENQCFNLDGIKLLDQIKGDILYLDPPYNSRQYAPNYHVLETVARYDYPKLHGVTGMRDWSALKSELCIKNKVSDYLTAVINKADFEHIVLSYSSDGLLDEDELIQIFKDNTNYKYFDIRKISYKKYQGKKTRTSEVKEYLIYGRKIKKIAKPVSITRDSGYVLNTDDNKVLGTINKRFFKGPFNYIGGKYKVLNQILPLFPGHINTFVDLFAGGCNVALNVKANKIICNDLNTRLIEFYNYLKTADNECVINDIEKLIKAYSLNKQNTEGYLKLRDDYNRKPNPIELYVLTCYSFNFQLRFNSKLEFNNPFGKDRSYFSPLMKENLLNFCSFAKQKEVSFTAKDFTDMDFSKLQEDDLVYCDPPYLITTGSYNDGKRGFKNWTHREEQQLYEILDCMNSRGIHFALSNVLEHKGQENLLLKKWSERYKVIRINSDYRNCNYHTAREGSDEVLIINY